MIISITFAGTIKPPMQLRQTIMFIPKGETDVLKIYIYTSDDIGETGLWNIDENKVLLSNASYSAFRNLKVQTEQKKFFQQLRKVSANLLP